MRYTVRCTCSTDMWLRTSTYISQSLKAVLKGATGTTAAATLCICTVCIRVCLICLLATSAACFLSSITFTATCITITTTTAAVSGITTSFDYYWYAQPRLEQCVI
jgi:hypothetical protein